MKAFLLTLFFAAFNLVEAQTFFDSTYTYLCIGDYQDGPMFTHHKYRMILDSVFSDTEYYKMEDDSYGVKSVNDYSFKCINGKAFYQHKNNGKVGIHLLYDFNLKEGDTIRVGGLGSAMLSLNSLMTVDSVRQVFFGGKMRKGFYVHSSFFKFLWIENIGSVENGVLYIDYMRMEVYNELVNLCKSDTLLYWKYHEVIKSGANTCNPVFYGSSIKDNDFLGYKMFPNPFKDNVHFLDWDGHLVDLKIYNVNGQMVFDAEVDTNMGLDLSTLAKGFYWVKMSNGQKFSTQMLVKE